MTTRRDYLRLTATAGLALAVSPHSVLAAFSANDLISREIPVSGERLPVVGLGSSASFARMAASGDVRGVQEVLDALLRHGGTVFDTAPSYGEAERVAAETARMYGYSERLFWATKVNVVAGRGGRADPVEARAQIERSFSLLGRSRLDLIQVHNMGDIQTQLGLLKEFREAGRLRYLGVTTTFPGQYDALEALMRRERLDFIGVDYAIDHRVMEERIFPLAQDRGMAVMAYQPFGRTRLWRKVEGHALPDWASESEIRSWAQYFLKIVVSHPAVTVTTPATRLAAHMVDNMEAARGSLPDQALRQRMINYVDSL